MSLFRSTFLHSANSDVAASREQDSEPIALDSESLLLLLLSLGMRLDADSREQDSEHSESLLLLNVFPNWLRAAYLRYVAAAVAAAVQAER